jgi:hypothetical protein
MITDRRHPVKKPLLLFTSILLIATSSVFPRQDKKPAISCKKAAFAALKALPQLHYDCPSDVADDYDDRILKTPGRSEALKDLMKELEAFTNPSWWDSSVNDLNACYQTGKAGPLDQEQQEQFNGPEYQPPLLGNNRIRLFLASDPCYQTEYGGSNGFILYREGSKVYVTQVLNGHYSRLGKSVFLRLFSSKAGDSIKITTANISAMQPDYSYHFFDIDRATHKAIPRKSTKRS